MGSFKEKNCWYIIGNRFLNIKSMNTVLILFGIGLLAGFLSGLIGIGGGIVIVPLLVYLFSMNQKMAQGTTLFMFLFPIGILGVYNSIKQALLIIKWQLLWL